ncbi:MAG: hypothetical protein GEU78_02285 [Actinobacteria bacterium]|nr:hypothetical protein [Actinomycetota bacterium]
MRFATILLCVALVLGTMVAPASARAKSRTGPYEGLASWLDIYDRKPWRRPKATVARLRSKGVRTLYLQTSNYQRRRDIMFRDETGDLLEAAHAVDMKVVAWYVPSFQKVQVDLRRSMKAIRYVSPKGHSFDSFAMDIEADNVGKISKRNGRLLSLSKEIRSAVGRGYPLGAIIPDPKTQTYWPNFPYRRVAKVYDVFLPMSYFTFRTHGYRKVYGYTKHSLRIIRAETGDPRVPIHVIGGLAGDASRAEIKAFTRAVREKRAVGASLYDLPLMSPSDWQHLRGIRGLRAPRSEPTAPRPQPDPHPDREPAVEPEGASFTSRILSVLFYF